MKNPPKKKQKYWYITEIWECVVCGRERKFRERVPFKPKFSVIMHQDACGEHFM